MAQKKIIACLTAAAFALASASVAAKQYAIEIIVFDRATERNIEKASAAEQWDFSSERINERVAEMAALAGRASKRATANRVFNLERVRSNLLESGYRILDTTRWQQPTSSYQYAPLIPLGDNETALAAGFVRVYTTSLIYADIDLQLSPPLRSAEISLVSDGDSAATTRPQPHYFISEKRRLKFNQIHYFDHPLFGAILGVWENKSAGG